MQLVGQERVMPKVELDGLPVIDADESEEITVAVRADDTSGSDCPAAQA